MPDFSRRALLGVTAAAVPALALSACAGGNPLVQPVQVNLQTAQTWAAEITAAVSGFAASATAALPAAAQTVAAQAVTALKSANAQFQALKSGATTYAGLVQEILAAVSQLLTVLPIPPAIAAGIQTGVMVLSAFIASAQIVVPPVPAALHRAALKGGLKR